jgi:hypothetical protein
VRKLSVALDEGVADKVARAADRAGMSVSAWLNHAAETELAIEPVWTPYANGRGITGR